MLLDDRYPVLETLESRDGVTLYRVEGGLVFYFDVRTPQDKDRFYRYRAAIRRLEELGLLEAQVSAKPGRYYAFFPERPLSGRRPPKEVLAALAPFGFGPEHVAMGEDGVAYLAPWPLRLGAARRGRGGFWSRVAPGLFLLGLGLLLLAQGLYRYFNPPEYVVPDLVGKTAREAFLLLRDTGLGLEVEEGNDPSRPKEVVLEQDPPPGTRLRAGRVVRLVLNQARLVPVPDLRGLPRAEAEDRISGLGFQVGRVAAVEAEEAAGTVLATSPPAGTPMAYGARVDLLVAGERSGERVVVPRLVGLKREDALFLLNAAGLLPQVEEVPSGAPEGLVLAQVPGPGEAVLPGSPVRLRVAVQGAVQLPEAFPGTPLRSVVLALDLPHEAQGRQVRPGGLRGAGGGGPEAFGDLPGPGGGPLPPLFGRGAFPGVGALRGRWAEEEALRFLLGKGYRLLWRNRRTPFGEVDLFLEKDGVYVVVEVKQRASARFGAPLEAITPGKVRRLLQSARFLLGRDDLPVRLEAVLVHGTPKDFRLEHLVLEL